MKSSNQLKEKETMPKESKSNAKGASTKLRHAPLDNQILISKKKAEGKFSRADQRKVIADGNDGEDVNLKSDFLDAKTSKKIMLQAQEQREELLNEEIGNAMYDGNSKKKGKGKGTNNNNNNSGFKAPGIGADLLTRGNDSDDSDVEVGGMHNNDDEDEDEEDYEDVEVGSDGYMDIADMEGISDAERSLMGSFFGGAAEV